MTTTVVKEKPILFRGEMVRAILDGRKTQTRRVVKPQPLTGDIVAPCHWTATGWSLAEDPASHSPAGCHCLAVKCPYGFPGERLWVREAWAANAFLNNHKPRDLRGETIYHRATYGNDSHFVWRPSIHMPRWACRLVLEITDVRVERLNEISEADAYAEGVTIPSHEAFASNGNLELRNEARCAFMKLWESIDGVGSWAANPWVWVASFRAIEGGVR